MPKRKPLKAHWCPSIGRAKCGGRQVKRRIKTREEWGAVPEVERCKLCDDVVKRDGKPRELGQWRSLAILESYHPPLEAIGRELGLPSVTTRRVLARARTVRL